MRRHCLSLAIGILFASGFNAQAADSPSPQKLIAQGKYLAIAADCGACHTPPNDGAAMSGGYAIQSPLGTIYASNITPSKVAGIGNYSEQDFARAVREGINKQGQYLYPAMPYISYSRITDQDIHALYAYFMHGVAPVDKPSTPTRLAFPFNIRSSMALWNTLFSRNKPFAPAEDVSAEVNRGNYLVNALEHCDTCHTPRNALMGQDDGKALSGGELGSWYAPNITPDKHSGIGNWSAAELAQYLKTGHLAGKAQAAGPMAEAVEHSTQHLDDSDIQAMVGYLQQIPAIDTGAEKSRDSYGQPANTELALRGNSSAVDSGWQIYSGSCANCHQAQGQGTAYYPSLFHNSATGADNPANLVAAILYGVHRDINGQQVAMPAFGPDGNYSVQLSDRQIADVSNYVLKNFGNPQVSVTADQVKEIRNGGKKPLLARLTSPAVMLTGGVVLILIIILLAFLVKKRRRQHVGK
ncbi:cytochrome c [Serratia sp. M24T3]|uniref:c-type cytochrome n=1 Tax=Serratia sp. M24T3 TaxID=932213 RepID=UPI00030CCC52|nr:cytochrome c [Serratia sp. M24T3]